MNERFGPSYVFRPVVVDNLFPRPSNALHVRVPEAAECLVGINLQMEYILKEDSLNVWMTNDVMELDKKKTSPFWLCRYNGKSLRFKVHLDPRTEEAIWADSFHSQEYGTLTGPELLCYLVLDHAIDWHRANDRAFDKLFRELRYDSFWVEYFDSIPSLHTIIGVLEV